jgi:polysaccharide deacetylase family protein (PEP-CTERM system associated)
LAVEGVIDLGVFFLATDCTRVTRKDPAHAGFAAAPPIVEAQTVVSFDVEEHFRIEAAVGLPIDPALKAHYGQRLEMSTRWILDQLDQAEVKATFFVVGEIARDKAGLVKTIAAAGHEVASHGWDHQRVLRLTPAAFREDVLRSKDALEQVTGQAVVGYRAPTFSILPETAWALDVLVEQDYVYDSSIYPVRHDRYGVPSAPRCPFVAVGPNHGLLELPPATLRLLKLNLPMGGGGYFRLFPLCMTEWAVRQAERRGWPPVAMLYFHPWEFDPDQERLPLGWLNRIRTYVGLGRSRTRLTTLLARHRFVRAIEIARRLAECRDLLPRFALAGEQSGRGTSAAVEPIGLVP